MFALRKSRLGLALLGLLVFVLALTQLSAKPPKADAVKVSVVAICANCREDTVDPRLENIRKEIQKTLPKLTSFKIAKMSCRPVTEGTQEKFELVDDEVVFLTVLRAGDKGSPTLLKLTPPGMGEVTYETSCGGFFTIITKHRTKSKDVLILAVRVKSCDK